MRRFSSMPVARVRLPGGGHLDAWVAEPWSARLVGLAGLREMPPATALLLPRCRAVHTLGMRFAIDVAFVSWPPAGGACEVASIALSVAPGRLVSARGRLAALEAAAGALAGPGFVPGASCRVRYQGVRR
jgi:uncharacterized protein